MFVRIWSFERNAWWKPDCWGYTENIAEAGLYKRDYAEKIVDAANRYLGPGEPLNEEIREIEDDKPGD